MIRGLLLSLGIMLISLSLLSITSPIYNTVGVSKPYCISIPSTAKVIATVYDNFTNVTIYVRIIHGNYSEIVRPPYVITLTNGKWIFEIYNETYPETFFKTVNETIIRKNEIIITQKTINFTRIVTTTNATYPVYVKLYVKCMRIFKFQEIGEILGAIMVISSVFLYLRKRF
ncbi:MAG: hypothetical protein RRE78_08560 [Acidianus sp.]|jgi:hypothetical protein|nr:hypothetical protein [Acidianus sp.]